MRRCRACVEHREQEEVKETRADRATVTAAFKDYNHEQGLRKGGAAVEACVQMRRGYEQG